MPKVSICIPAFNQTEYLRKAIDSVLVQSYSDYEVIITDDSTTDSVKQLVEAYGMPHKLQYYKNRVRLGTPENWNEAIRRSSGDYIKILHHDDWFSSEESLAYYVAMLDGHPESNFAFSATKAFTPGVGQRDHLVTQADVEALRMDPLLLYRNNIIGAPSTVIFRRHSGLLFDKRFKWLVDIDYYIRMISRNRNILYTPEFLVVTCEPEERVSNNCKGNMEVEVFEYLLLLSKIYRQRKMYNSLAVRSCLLKAIEVCDRYSINSRADVIRCGLDGALPGEVQTYLRLKATTPTLARAYKKILRQHSWKTLAVH